MRTVFQRGLLIASSLAIGIVCAEATTRLLDLAPEVTFRDLGRYRLSENPRLGYEPVPESAIRESQTDGGERSNRDGFRDRDHPHAGAPGTFRVLILGDSIAVGFRIAERDSVFPARLEARLNSRGLSAEVLNLGVMGYNTMQEVEMLEVKGLDYDPDLVIVAFCLNDFERSDGQLLDGLLAIEAGRAPRDDAPWRRRLASSALYRTLRYRVWPRFRPPVTELRERYAPLYENKVLESLTELGSLSRRHDFDTLVAVFPFFRDLRRYDSRYLELHRRLGRHCAANGLGFLDLLETFRDCERRAGRPVALDTLHPDAAGHDCAAGALAEEVLRIGQVVPM